MALPFFLVSFFFALVFLTLSACGVGGYPASFLLLFISDTLWQDYKSGIVQSLKPWSMALSLVELRFYRFVLGFFLTPPA